MNILEARRRTLGGHILKKTAQGNPAIATDSLARRYPGITMQGWTEQDGTPTPETPVPIVSAGTWDETAQKWEYEIEISNAEQNPTEIQTVTLTSDRPLTKWDRLEKRNGQWGWVYKSAEVVFDGDTSEAWLLYNTLTDANVFYIDISDTLDKASGMEIFCNKMENVRNGYNVDRPYIICGHNNYSNVYVNVKPIDASKASGFKTWLSENPLTVLFETSTETFVPLTSAEQEAMNALHTYRPTTVLSNQQDCEMALTYKTRKSMEVTA